MNTFYQLIFVLITASFFIASNVIAGQWAKTNNHLLWIPISAFAIIGYIFFGLLVKQTNLAISSGLVDALIVVVSISIGIFILKDVVNIKQIIGLIFAIIATFLIL